MDRSICRRFQRKGYMPSPEIEITIPEWIELLAVLTSALGGAIAARHKDFDIGGIIALALVTGVGGGIFRDVTMGATPPAALAQSRFLLIVLAAAALGFFFGEWIGRFQTALILLDAIALGLWASLGAEKADAYGLPFLTAVLLGIITGVGGGILRDILSGDMPVVFRREVYATIAAIGSATYLLLKPTELTATNAAVIATTFVFTLRLLAIRYRLDAPRPSDIQRLLRRQRQT
jgi:uncharacterized membrane protein YeiH